MTEVTITIADEDDGVSDDNNYFFSLCTCLCTRVYAYIHLSYLLNICIYPFIYLFNYLFIYIAPIYKEVSVRLSYSMCA